MRFLTPSAVAFAGVVISGIAGAVHSARLMKQFLPDLPRSLRRDLGTGRDPSLFFRDVYTAEGRRTRAQMGRYFLVGMALMVIAVAMEPRADDPPAYAWLLTFAGLYALGMLITRDMRARSGAGTDDGTVTYDRDAPAASSDPRLRPRFGPDDRALCECCGFPTLGMVDDKGTLADECPLCDYDESTMHADLAACRERFKRTLTALDPAQMASWGGRPFTARQLTLKVALLKRYEAMAREGAYDDAGRWAKVHALEKQMSELAFDIAEEREHPDEDDGASAGNGEPASTPDA